MDTAIAIRTAVVCDGAVNIQAGAGIVADSVPTLEWEETLSKARAMLRAISMCQWRAMPFWKGRVEPRRVYFLSMWLISED